MVQPNIAKIARELAKLTKDKSKSELSDKLDASSETIQMGEDVFTRHEPQTNPKSTMTTEQFEKLIKMLKSASKVKKGKTKFAPISTTLYPATYAVRHCTLPFVTNTHRISLMFFYVFCLI